MIELIVVVVALIQFVVQLVLLVERFQIVELIVVECFVVHFVQCSFEFLHCYLK